jgi:hypothetical protein
MLFSRSLFSGLGLHIKNNPESQVRGDFRDLYLINDYSTTAKESLMHQGDQD